MTWLPARLCAVLQKSLNPKVQPNFRQSYCPLLSGQLGYKDAMGNCVRSLPKVNIYCPPRQPEENEVAETWSVLGKSVLAVPNDSLILCVPGNVLHKFSRDWNVRPTGCNSLNLSSLLSSWIHFLHLPFSNHQEPPLITVTSQRLQGNGLAVSMDIFLSPIQCITSCPIACACLIDFPATTLRHLLTA